MLKLNVSVDNDALRQLQSTLEKFGAGVFPNTAQSMARGARVVQYIWRGFAGGGSLPGIEPLKRPSGAYARSIKVKKNGPFDYEIISNADVAKWIEEGTDELDMKTTHPFGRRSRVSEKGVPYLIIPFRWGTPKTVGFRNIIPEQVYSIVKNKKKFTQTKTVTSADNGEKTPNARGEMIGRAAYSDVSEKKGWGSVLTADMDEGVTNNMVGMSSMLGQNGKASGYFTFRVISAASPQGSWIKPAVKARPVTRTVAGITQNIISRDVENAIKEDLGI